MQNFDDAFFSGIQAARQVKRSQIEIEDVMKEFGASLALATDGQVTVALRERNALSDFLSKNPSESKRTKVLVVVPVNQPTPNTPSEAREVAQLRPAPDGYPCWLIYGGQEFGCNNKQELEVELAKLAASPRMGRAILSVMGA